MFNYKVTVKPNDGIEPGAFVGINFGKDGYFDFDSFDGDNEVYDVVSEYDIERQLDLSDSVVSYEVKQEGNEN